PVLPQLQNSFAVKSRGARSKFAAWIPAKILDRNLAEINFGERHGFPFSRGLSDIVDVVNNDGQPLIACAVSIDSTSRLSRRLNFNALGPRLHRIVWINAFHEKVGMSVEVIVLREDARMFRHACSKQIR